MSDIHREAELLLREFKGDNYSFGAGVLDKAGDLAKRYGKKFFLIHGKTVESKGYIPIVEKSFERNGIELVAKCQGAAPNSPITDVVRVRDEILGSNVDGIVAFGGGSLIDAGKGSNVVASLGGDCCDYFGVDKVKARMAETGKGLLPYIAIMTASASAAHLTKYSNLTDMEKFQKSLIIDNEVTPVAALFDYDLTKHMPEMFTKVGAFDGICHLLEVYFGADPSGEKFPLMERIALTGVELIISSLEKCVAEPGSEELRTNIGLGTDLGGYAIMVGSTNGPHLNSFSMVDLMDHGMATALLTPYYLVFFAPALETRVRKIAGIYQKYGYVDSDVKFDALHGRDLGLALAEGMTTLANRIGFPTTLSEVNGYDSSVHINRILEAAKQPQYATKLQGMPISMKPEEVDEYMGSILTAAEDGDFSKVTLHADFK
ncbi:iron-containing alcohol dehydrogenase [Candidatus Hydrogenedentota bacterium]